MNSILNPAGESSAPRSPLRQRHNEVTRKAILDAARSVFAEKGFTGSSVKYLAETAGVAVQTIYSTFGSKAGVLAALPDQIDEEAGVVELAQQILQSTDPPEAMALAARITRRIYERCGDIVHILQSGSAVDAQVANVLSEGLRRRRTGMGLLTERMEKLGALKSGLTSERAADIAYALLTDQVCDLLVEQRGWSFDEYESWLGTTLVTLLLEDPSGEK